ncbi:hypothetical protein Ppa06_62810 [Planomonospora parontospora subsp. parontospora]|uniref:Polysaccharide chain length determinant N-terminal domain-containing protein n=2 Tax=Planomonospora parontospora TaxID=58119 RepID=A0AA37BMX8_9ACTN|nr:Wzz/FepE/Etk N-terminal domain-containing protein [Planomonospora parontospora]GGK95208.1 hypothetical protein GCM10010126_63330 [Planomonospora parontospora]GII12483.1 hypothetical protein Ppa06_62810 [Planomonospora parontospora subsp. parontospora]
MAGGQATPFRSQLLVQALRYRKALITVCVLLGTLLGVGAAQLMPQSYKASTTVLIIPLSGNPYSPEGRGDDLINLASETQLVTADTVMNRVASTLGGSVDRASIPDRVTVEVPANTQTLLITFTAGDPDTASKGAAAFANSYLTYRRNRSESIIDGKIKQVEEQSAKVDASLRKATNDLSSGKLSSARRTYLTQRVTQFTNQLAVLEEQANDLASTPIFPGQVISSTPASSGSSLLGTPELGVAGLLAGLLGGLGLGMLREYGDDRLRDAESVERYGVPVLAVRSMPAQPYEPLTTPDSQDDEELRKLRVAVLTRITDMPASMLVAGVSGNDHAARLSADLALALGAGGTETILIDADHTATPSASALLGATIQRGLTDVLLDHDDPQALLREAGPQTQLLPQGTDLKNASSHFLGRGLFQTVNVFRHSADLVIVTGPPLDDPDGQALNMVSYATLLVITAGVTRRREVRAAYAQAEQAEAKIIGAVVLTPPSRRELRAAVAREASRATAEPILVESSVMSAITAAEPRDRAGEAEVVIEDPEVVDEDAVVEEPEIVVLDLPDPDDEPRPMTDEAPTMAFPRINNDTPAKTGRSK